MTSISSSFFIFKGIRNFTKSVSDFRFSVVPIILRNNASAAIKFIYVTEVHYSIFSIETSLLKI